MKTYKSVADHVEVAKALAAEHGGVLPNVGWLTKNGHVALYAAMRNHPEAFTEVPRSVGRVVEVKTLAEQVTLAERLTAENGGVFPSVTTLNKAGLNSLYAATRKHPEAFAHLSRPTRGGGKSVSEHVADAKRLAAENGGIFPKTTWLLRNGYTGLYAAMRKHPEVFVEAVGVAVTPRVKAAEKTLEEHVADAERLAANNGGVLPSSAWRVKNGFASLNRAVKAHPETFGHLLPKVVPSVEVVTPSVEVVTPISVAPPSEEVSPVEVTPVEVTPVEVTVTPEVVVITVTPAPVEYT